MRYSGISLYEEEAGSETYQHSGHTKNRFLRKTQKYRAEICEEEEEGEYEEEEAEEEEEEVIYSIVLSVICISKNNVSQLSIARKALIVTTVRSKHKIHMRTSMMRTCSEGESQEG